MKLVDPTYLTDRLSSFLVATEMGNRVASIISHLFDDQLRSRRLTGVIISNDGSVHDFNRSSSENSFGDRRFLDHLHLRSRDERDEREERYGSE